MHDMLECGCKAMVIEASSIGLKHYRLADITFDVGIFTNFSHDHIGGVEHKDMAEYLYCKSLLSDSADTLPEILTMKNLPKSQSLQLKNL